MSKFSLSYSNNVLFADIRGQWTLETAKAYAKAYRDCVAPLLGKPWAHLVYLHDWQLGSPDIEPVITELVSWCFINDIHATAMVYPKNSLKDYQVKRMVLSQLDNYRTEYFEEESDALDWLRSQGFRPDSVQSR